MAAAQTMDVDELRERVDAMRRSEADIVEQITAHLEQVASLQQLQAQTRAARECVEAELVHAARGSMELESLASRQIQRRTRRTPRQVSQESARDVIVRLARFTDEQLAEMLGCTVAQAQRHRERLSHLVRVADDSGERVVYEYAPPAGAGTAFEAQRRLRVVDTIEAQADLAMAGDGQANRSMLSSVKDKEIRKVVVWAVREGWRLTDRGGGGHAMSLERDGYQPITLVSSPRNSEAAADQLRRKVQRRQRIAL